MKYILVLFLGLILTIGAGLFGCVIFAILYTLRWFLLIAIILILIGVFCEFIKNSN